MAQIVRIAPSSPSVAAKMALDLPQGYRNQRPHDCHGAPQSPDTSHSQHRHMSPIVAPPMICITAPIATHACLARALTRYTRTCAHTRIRAYALSYLCYLYSVFHLSLCVMCVSLSICISARPPSSKLLIHVFLPLMQAVCLLSVAEAGAGADC